MNTEFQSVKSTQEKIVTVVSNFAKVTDMTLAPSSLR